MNDAVTETAHVFTCAGQRLVGVLHCPRRPRRLAVVIVVGGPQYRVGSHRHFVELARHLAEQGFAVLRFDYRGMGDSDGDSPGFEHVTPDIAAAIDVVHAQIPGLAGVALWGMCDAVPPIARSAAQRFDVVGMVLLNPWVRETASHDAVLLRHYYHRRLLRREFWANLFTGRSDVAALPRSLANLLRARLDRLWSARGGDHPDTLAGRIVAHLARAQGEVLLVMSGQDLTAREFDMAAKQHRAWTNLCASPRFQRVDVAAADHTLSDPAIKETVNQETNAWLDALEERACVRLADPAPEPNDAPRASQWPGPRRAEF